MSMNDMYDAQRRAIAQTQQAKAKESRDNNKKINKKHFNEEDSTRVVKVDTWWDKLKSKLTKS